METLNDEAWKAAQTAGGILRIDPKILYSQFAGETGNFTNSGAQKYNYAGIMYPGTHKQRGYNSAQDFAISYSNIIQSNFKNAVGVGDNLGAFVDALNNGRNGYKYFGNGISASDYFKMINSQMSRIFGPSVGGNTTNAPQTPTETPKENKGFFDFGVTDWLTSQAANIALGGLGLALILFAVWANRPSSVVNVVKSVAK